MARIIFVNVPLHINIYLIDIMIDNATTSHTSKKTNQIIRYLNLAYFVIIKAAAVQVKMFILQISTVITLTDLVLQFNNIMFHYLLLL